MVHYRRYENVRPKYCVTWVRHKCMINIQLKLYLSQLNRLENQQQDRVKNKTIKILGMNIKCSGWRLGITIIIILYGWYNVMFIQHVHYNMQWSHNRAGSFLIVDTSAVNSKDITQNKGTIFSIHEYNLLNYIIKSIGIIFS